MKGSNIMKIPSRIGEGLSGLSRGNTSENGVALKEVLNHMAQNLTDSVTALTALQVLVAAAADFAAFKTAVGLWTLPADTIEQSDDVGR